MQTAPGKMNLPRREARSLSQFRSWRDDDDVDDDAPRRSVTRLSLIITTRILRRGHCRSALMHISRWNGNSDAPTQAVTELAA